MTIKDLDGNKTKKFGGNRQTFFCFYIDFCRKCGKI